VLPAGPAASTTEVEKEVDGGPHGGRCRWVWQCPPRLKKTSMAGPLGAVPVGPAASTTEVEEDVDDGPPGGCYRFVLQRAPLRLKKTSMVGPLGALPAGPTASTTDVEDDIDGEPPGGRCRWVRQHPPPWLKTTESRSHPVSKYSSVRRCSMFHRLGSGSPFSLARRTHPGWQTWVTQKGPSQPG
jgi:hypothetical protein